MLKTVGVKILVSLSLVFFGFVFGYFSKGTAVNDPIQESTTPIQELPKCLLGRCPQYFSMDVDGDMLAESVVVIPTAMTQGAGKVWIIDDDEIIFDSGELMRIEIIQTKEQVEKGNGFTLLYGMESNSTKVSEKEFIYQNGQFTIGGN